MVSVTETAQVEPKGGRVGAPAASTGTCGPRADRTKSRDPTYAVLRTVQLVHLIPITGCFRLNAQGRGVSRIPIITQSDSR